MLVACHDISYAYRTLYYGMIDVIATECNSLTLTQGYIPPIKEMN